MKILLTGSSGLIGNYIAKNFPDKTNLLVPTTKELDMASGKSIDDFFSRIKPEIVIHSAGATGILEGEKERGNKRGVFWTTNVFGSKRLVVNCKKNKTFLIYFSGEVVFSGVKIRQGPYKEDDLPDRSNKYLSWYGQTKKAVEDLMRKTLPFYAIVRLGSVVGRGKQPRPDYLRKIIIAYLANNLNPMFTDQFISLADNKDVLKIIDMIIRQKKSGTFHVASSDRFSPYELSSYLIYKVFGKKNVVRPSSIVGYLKKNPATFPQFSGLLAERTEEFFNIDYPSWREIVDSYSDELKSIYAK